LDENPNLDHLQSVRLMLTMKKTEFRKQFDIISKLFKILPIRLLNVDSTGIGTNIGEDLRKRFGSRINDMKFNSENKGEMATNLKLRTAHQAVVSNTGRILKQENSRIFTGNPYVIDSPYLAGISKSLSNLTPPPKHFSEFSMQ